MPSLDLTPKSLGGFPPRAPFPPTRTLFKAKASFTYFSGLYLWSLRHILLQRTLLF